MVFFFYFSEYDVPRASADVYDVPSGRYRSSHATDLSDRSSGVSLFSSGSSDASCGLSNAHLSASSESLSLSSAMGRVSGRSSRSSVVDHNPALELYDVPVQRDAKEPQETYDVPKPIVADVYDVPRGRDPADVIEETYDNPRSEPAKVTLPLALDAAMETLSRLDAEVSSAVTNVLASPPSEPDWAELQLRVFRLRGSLQELCDFARGAIGNAAERIKSGVGDEGVGVRLARLLGPLHNANGIVQRASHAWTDLVATSRRRPDSGEFEQLVACCGSLGDDARQVSAAALSMLHIALFFKRLERESFVTRHRSCRQFTGPLTKSGSHARRPRFYFHSLSLRSGRLVHPGERARAVHGRRQEGVERGRLRLREPRVEGQVRRGQRGGEALPAARHEGRVRRARRPIGGPARSAFQQGSSELYKISQTAFARGH